MLGFDAQIRGPSLRQDFVAAIATLGAVAAGVALFEAALFPGLLIGAAAALAPRFLPDHRPKLRQGLRPPFDSTARRPISPAARQPVGKTPLAASAGFAVKPALAKTLTFRIVATTIEFTAHYVVIGELGAAAGLSAFGLVFGPVFYFVHEAAWDYLDPPVGRKAGLPGGAIALPAYPPLRPDTNAPAAGWNGIIVRRPLAKTLTFHTIATTVDFTAHLVVVGDLATATALSAFNFVAGPFVYLGHEMIWDHFGSSNARAAAPPAPTILSPAPG